MFFLSRDRQKLAFVQHQLAALSQLLGTFRSEIMSLADDVKSRLASLDTAVTTETDLLTSVSTMVQGLVTEIQTLNDQLKQANEDDDPDAVAEVAAGFDALTSRLDANRAALQTLANTKADTGQPIPPVDDSTA